MIFLIFILFVLAPFSSFAQPPLPAYLPSLESFEEENSHGGEYPLPSLGGMQQPPSSPEKKKDKTEVTCKTEATFNNKTNIGEFFGGVVIKNSQFDLFCDRLIVTLRKDHRGMEQGEAIGRVVIIQENTDSEGKVIRSVGHAGRAHYQPATGNITLTDWPQLQQGINNHIASNKNTKMILNKDGRSTTVGQSKTVIVDTQKVTTSSSHP